MNPPTDKTPRPEFFTLLDKLRAEREERERQERKSREDKKLARLRPWWIDAAQ